MFPEEAIWLGKSLERFAADELSPIINLGSSSADYRSEAGRQIETSVFGPLKNRGVRVIHVDLKNAPGVDIAGDVCDPVVRARIAAEKPRALLCNNILEHVIDREQIAIACDELLPRAGLLFVSAPFRYPFHPDPIDTGFRPDPSAIHALWPRFAQLDGQLIKSGNYAQQLLAKPRLLVRDAYLLAAGFIKPTRWRVLVGNYRFLIPHYWATCVVLRKEAGRSVHAHE